MSKLLVVVGALALAGVALADEPMDKPGVRNPSDMKLGPIPALPTCVTGSPQLGDPMTAQFIMYLKVNAGCEIPWHWHSAGEHLMLVSGTARTGMRDGGNTQTATVKPGGFVVLPPKHVHQVKCDKGCELYLYSDGKFDIHYVDPKGNEISPEDAVKTVKETVATR
jgi:quercetin dioxygenase-like cupin family protein